MMYTPRGGMGAIPIMATEPRSGRIELAAVPVAVHHARRWAAEQLSSCDPPPAADVIDAAVLLVSELVTNAIHAVGGALPVRAGAAAGDGQPQVALTVTRMPGTVLVEVYDRARQLVAPPCDSDDDDEGGRGLALIAALSKDWGCRPVPGGKVVWCELVD